MSVSKADYKTINQNVKKKIYRSKMVVIVGFGATAVGLTALALPFFAPAFRKICIPFVPATTCQIMNVMKALSNRSGTVVDLGSGNGSIVIEAAKKFGLQSTGIELNQLLIIQSRIIATYKQVSHLTTFQRKDLWKADISSYDNIIIYGVPEMMDELVIKLENEMKSDAILIAGSYPVKQWTPEYVVGDEYESVYVYKKPENLVQLSFKKIKQAVPLDESI